MSSKKPAKKPYVSRLDKLKMPTYQEDIDPRHVKPKVQGRPKFGSENRVPFSVTMAPDTRAKLQAYATKSKKSCGMVIEDALKLLFIGGQQQNQKSQ